MLFKNGDYKPIAAKTLKSIDTSVISCIRYSIQYLIFFLFFLTKFFSIYLFSSPENRFDRFGTMWSQIRRAVLLLEHVRSELQKQTTYDQTHDQRMWRATEISMPILHEIFHPETDVKNSRGIRTPSVTRWNQKKSSSSSKLDLRRLNRMKYDAGQKLDKTKQFCG